jgi:DNA-binding XRE family transcriptional regulator
MSVQVQSLKLEGAEFVVLERCEYERLRALEQSDNSKKLPAWPEADSKGNRPALEFARVSIARDIIRERTALGLTQQQFAKLAGIRQETLCRLETGKHSPNVRTVDKIEAALKQAQRRSARSAKGKSRSRKN